MAFHCIMEKGCAGRLHHEIISAEVLKQKLMLWQLTSRVAKLTRQYLQGQIESTQKRLSKPKQALVTHMPPVPSQKSPDLNAVVCSFV